MLVSVYCTHCDVYWVGPGQPCWVCQRPGEPHQSPQITSQSTVYDAAAAI